MFRSASDAPSAMVILSVEALAIARVPQPKACPINSKFVFVVVPQVPEPSPVAISLSLRLFTYVLAIVCSLCRYFGPNR